MYTFSHNHRPAASAGSPACTRSPWCTGRGACSRPSARRRRARTGCTGRAFGWRGTWRLVVAGQSGLGRWWWWWSREWMWCTFSWWAVSWSLHNEVVNDAPEDHVFIGRWYTAEIGKQLFNCWSEIIQFWRKLCEINAVADCFSFRVADCWSGCVCKLLEFFICGVGSWL